MTSKAVAAEPDTKLRDQPSSCDQIGMTRPSVARAEKANANARKPKATTAHGSIDGDDRVLLMPSPGLARRDHSARGGAQANDGLGGHV
ncbi:MAG: hypothetical protein U1E17_16280 [Geminicoccaceae bacterium]